MHLRDRVLDPNFEKEKKMTEKEKEEAAKKAATASTKDGGQKGLDGRVVSSNPWLNMAI